MVAREWMPLDARKSQKQSYVSSLTLLAVPLLYHKSIPMYFYALPLPSVFTSKALCLLHSKEWQPAAITLRAISTLSLLKP